jgi:HK97 gp10 family phage protein
MGDGVMARMTIKGLDEYAMKLSRLGAAAPEIAKRAVMAGANPVADEIRKELEKNLAGSKYSTGDLLDSFGIAPPDVDSRGNTNTKIGFSGYDRKGVPNALKARAMESGTSTQPKRPFVRPAVNRVKQKAIEEMGKSIDADLRIFAFKK